jgi:A/G-specific adenine glycosylase
VLIRSKRIRSIPTPSANVIKSFRRKLLEWGTRNFAPFPWRLTRNSFHALIAEIMLQRTKAEQVERVYMEFARRYKTPEDVLEDTEDHLLSLLRPLGLYWRSKTILKLVAELHVKGIPTDLGDLLDLPGVGPYAAAAFLSFHRGHRAVIVDSNVVRLYGRYFGFVTDPETRRFKQFLDLADRITPRRDFRKFNYALLDHTRMLCKHKPLCPRCPLNGNCCFGRNILGERRRRSI